MTKPKKMLKKHLKMIDSAKTYRIGVGRDYTYDDVMFLVDHRLLQPTEQSKFRFIPTEKGLEALKTGFYVPVPISEHFARPEVYTEQTSDPKRIRINSTLGTDELPVIQTYGVFTVHETLGETDPRSKKKITVTHRPAGFAIARFPSQEKAKSFAKHLFQRCGMIGEHAKFNDISINHEKWFYDPIKAAIEEYNEINPT